MFGNACPVEGNGNVQDQAILNYREGYGNTFTVKGDGNAHSYQLFVDTKWAKEMKLFKGGTCFIESVS